MLKPFRYFFAVLAIMLLTGCIGNTTPEDASYLRFSKGAYGGKFLQWLGVAAEGDYCQLTSSEDSYEWTVEDVEFLKERCPEDSELVQMLRTLQAVQAAQEPQGG